MKILILSCNTGEGHNSAAKAIAEHAELAGHEVQLKDMMAMASDKVSKRVGGTYVSIVKYCPWLFQALYQIAGKISSERHKSPVYYANILMAGKLQAYLEAHPCDVIITTHLFPAETLTYLKRKGRLRQKVIAVSTDYTCIPFWEETECDLYTVAHEQQIGEYMMRGIPIERLKPLGIPVGRSFEQRKEKEAARLLLGLPRKVPVYLIMGGSMGFGKMHLFTQKLARGCVNGEQMVIICGNNQRLYQRMQDQFKASRNVHVVGFTSQIADYMDACDVVFTKPGGLSSTEAAVKGIPIVHTAPIPGCETKNVAFFTKNGMSVGTKRISEQLYYGRKLIYDMKYRRFMQEAQRKGLPRDAAAQILETAQGIAGQKKEN